MKLIKQTRFWVSIAIFVALFASAFVIKSFAWNAGAWDTSGSWGGYGYTPCPANSSCVFNNPIIFPNPSTPIPTTYGYNSINGLASGLYITDIYNNTIQMNSTGMNIASNSSYPLILSGGGNLGTASLIIENVSGANGAIFQNNSLALVDFGFKINNGTQLNLRMDDRPGFPPGSYANLVPQFEFMNPVPSNAPSFWFIIANPFVGTGLGISFSTATAGIAITMATNAGLGLSTLTQNNAIMNTGPIYPRNPANVAQTLTQPTIQPVYNNNLAGLSYTGWSVTGSGNLVNGVLTVNLGLPFDNVNAYRCSTNYDGVPASVAGFLAITKNSGSQFVITSVNSTGGTNTTDANKVQWTCIGY